MMSNPHEPPPSDAQPSQPDKPVDLSDEPPTTLSLKARLCLMMYLQYFVQGCYLPIASVFVQDALGFSSWQVGLFGSALAVGPILAPFIVGQVVDRWFSTQRVLAACHLFGALFMLLLYARAYYWTYSELNVAMIVALGTVYSILYVPTMMLTNSLAFHHLRRREKEFPIIRLFGTLGFLTPAYLIEFWWLWGLEGEELNSARSIAFVMSGVVGLVMAVYCLTLPRTPPERRDDRRYAPGAVIGMLRVRYFLVLVVITFLIAMVHKFYFVWNSPFLRAVLDSGDWRGAGEQSLSSIGQICELVVMALLGLMISRLGFKRTMVIGAVAYALRCVLFAMVFAGDLPFGGKLALVAVGQGLHGVCFGCFLAAGYIFVDRVAPKDLRGSVQTVYGTCVIALGFFVGSLLAGWVGNIFETSAGHNWIGIWLTCGAWAAMCVVALVALFQPPDMKAESAGKEFVK